MNKSVCVITGDLVKSSALAHSEFEAVMQALEHAGHEIGRWATSAPLPPERFQGDGWQILLISPHLALRAALYLRSAVRHACGSADTRIVAAIGPATLGDRLASSSGQAFEQSGRRLEQLRGRRLWAFDGALSDTSAITMGDGLFAVCDALSQGWTARQAEIVGRLIVPQAPTMNDLAGQMDIQPQTVQAHFAAAGGHGLLDGIEAFESTFIEPEAL